MIEFGKLTFIDYSVFVVLVTSVIFSTLRGMTRELLGLIGWAVSVLVANYTQPVLRDHLHNLTSANELSTGLAWAIPFALTVILWFLLASLLSPGLTRAGLGGLDRWLGIVFGLIRGYFLVLLAFIGAVLAFEGETKLPEAIQEAESIPIFSKSARYFARFAPDDYSNKLNSSLSDHDSFGANVSKSVDDMINNSAEIVKKPLELLSDEKGT